MGWGFSLPSLPRPPAPPFVPPAAAKVITSPAAPLVKAAQVIATSSPVQGGAIGKALKGTAATAAATQERAGQAVSAAVVGDLNTAARRGLQAVAEPSKASNRATLEVYNAIPAPVRSIVTTIVGAVFPVTQFVFMALDLQIAAEARRVAKLKAQLATADAAEAEKIRAEIRQIEAEMEAMRADRNKQASAMNLQGKPPTFGESITYSWLNAFNKLKG